MKYIFFLVFLFLIACSSEEDKALRMALEHAGSNRIELEKVLEHYKDDELKLKAAKFLIRAMPYNYSTDGYFLTPEQTEYRLDITPFPHDTAVTLYCDSLRNNGYSLQKPILYDSRSLSARYIINNIELAFEVWQKPWAREVNFDDFCRYILPYRAQNENISRMRKELKELFLPILDSLQVTTPLEACVAVNEQLRKMIRYRTTGSPFYPTLEETYKTGFSNCEGLCNFGAYAMRAAGIPVVIDMTIWVRFDLSHYWCAVLQDGKFHSFGPGEQHPGETLFTERRRIPAKVYRKTFGEFTNTYHYKEDGYATFLKSPFYSDVTEEYMDPLVTLRIKPIIAKKKKDPVYLCTLNHYEWLPVAVGEIDTNGDAVFHKVSGDNLFVVADSPDGKTLRFVSHHFYTDLSGNINEFIPDHSVKVSHTFTKRPRKRTQEHTLYYWEPEVESFKYLPYKETNDTTQTYDNIPGNSLLKLMIPERIFNQRMFFLENGEIKMY